MIDSVLLRVYNHYLATDINRLFTGLECITGDL